MEPSQTHGATLPQQNLTRSVGGCPSGPRPMDLLQGGQEGANPSAGQRVAYNKELTRLDVFKMFNRNTKNLPIKEQVRIVYGAFGDNYEVAISEEEFVPTLSKFLSKSEIMFKECKYNMKFFATKHKNWLSKIILKASQF